MLIAVPLTELCTYYLVNLVHVRWEHCHRSSHLVCVRMLLLHFRIDGGYYVWPLSPYPGNSQRLEHIAALSVEISTHCCAPCRTLYPLLFLFHTLALGPNFR